MRPRTGFALAIALVALVLIAVLVSGALFAANQETHATESEILDQQITSLAERSIAIAVDQWSCGECDVMTPGSVISLATEAVTPLETTVYITRLDSTLYLLTGEARMIRAGAATVRRRSSIIVAVTRDSLGVATAARVGGESWVAGYQN